MKLKWVVNPSSNKPDPMLTMSVLVVTAASIKFLCEGISFSVYGHPVDLGHVDSLTYGALLSPVLGVHGYLKGKQQKRDKADSPDEECNDNKN